MGKKDFTETIKNMIRNILYMKREISRPLKIAALYVAVSIAWILTSDTLLLVLERKGIGIDLINSVKGVFFIILTGWMLYITIKKQYRSLNDHYEREIHLKDELQKKIQIIEKSLAENKRLAEVVDRINNMVIITDRNGVITWVNPAFVKFTGYSFDEAVGKTPYFLHGSETSLSAQPKVETLTGNDDFFSFEILNYTKSGEAYWVKINITAIYDKNNEVERFISIQDIITERKIREEKIKEQNKTLRKVAWANSHAIRKPVAAILGLINLCKETDKAGDTEEIYNLLEKSALELDAVTREIATEINKSEDHHKKQY